MTRPTYTKEAVRKKLEGDVRLEVLIDTDGRVTALKVLQSLPDLDQQAIKTVENDWRFRPAMKDGRPVAS